VKVLSSPADVSERVGFQNATGLFREGENQWWPPSRKTCQWL